MSFDIIGLRNKILQSNAPWLLDVKIQLNSRFQYILKLIVNNKYSTVNISDIDCNEKEINGVPFIVVLR